MKQTLWHKFQQATERQEIGRLNTADLERKRALCLATDEAKVIREITIGLIDSQLKHIRKSTGQCHEC
jgi:hypothetical protein